jgi:hypothetical protein
LLFISTIGVRIAFELSFKKRLEINQRLSGVVVNVVKNISLLPTKYKL